ncbi:MAG: hypothetical protein JSS49_30455 [Planctomycetes bacterium]|nr:hypothetical protein [Planctomycetota bacterium]
MAARPKVHKFKLEDFRGGQVAGVLCLAAFRDRTLLKPVEKWVADGLLVFGAGGRDVCEDMLYLASERPTPAIEDGSKPKEPTKAKSVKPGPEPFRKRGGVKGAGWLSQDLVFVDPLVLPRGFHITEATETKTEEWYACRSAVLRIEKETGEKPLICKINNVLRVIEQRFLTGVKPEGTL